MGFVGKIIDLFPSGNALIMATVQKVPLGKRGILGGFSGSYKIPPDPPLGKGGISGSSRLAPPCKVRRVG